MNDGIRTYHPDDAKPKYEISLKQFNGFCEIGKDLSLTCPYYYLGQPDGGEELVVFKACSPQQFAEVHGSLIKTIQSFRDANIFSTLRDKNEVGNIHEDELTACGMCRAAQKNIIEKFLSKNRV